MQFKPFHGIKQFTNYLILALHGIASSPNKYSHSLAFQIANKALELVFAVTTSVILSKYLGPSNLGFYSYALSVYYILTPLRSLGLSTALSIAFDQEKNHKNLIRSALLVNIFGALISSILLFVVWLYSSVTTRNALFALIPILFIAGISEPLESKLFNDHKAFIVSRVNLTQTFLGFILVSLFAFAGLETEWFIAILFFQLSFKYAVFAKKTGFTLHLIFDHVQYKAIFLLVKNSFPFAISSLGVFIYTRSDQIMLEWLASSKDVGFYAIGLKFVETLFFIPMIISQNSLPRIQQLGRSKETFNMFMLLAISGLILLAIGYISFPSIIVFLYGANFLSAVPVCLIALPLVLLVSLGCGLDTVMLCKDKGAFLAIKSVFMASTNIILNYFCILKYKAIGAVFATVVTQSLGVFLTICVVMLLRHTPNSKEKIKTA